MALYRFSESLLKAIVFVTPPPQINPPYSPFFLPVASVTRKRNNVRRKKLAVFILPENAFTENWAVPNLYISKVGVPGVMKGTTPLSLLICKCWLLPLYYAGGIVIISWNSIKVHHIRDLLLYLQPQPIFINTWDHYTQFPEFLKEIQSGLEKTVHSQ